MTQTTGGGRRFAYLSNATVDFDAPALAQLVDSCRRHNTRLGVTGILLFLDGRFAQVIEGPAASIDEVIGRIDRDPRHRDIVVLADAAMAEPLFDGWNMAAQSDPSPAASSSFAHLVAARLRRSGDPAAAEVAGMLGRFWTEFAS